MRQIGSMPGTLVLSCVDFFVDGMDGLGIFLDLPHIAAAEIGVLAIWL
jgi:hypothetical protein